MCFTKAFGVVFLGSPRHTFNHEVKELPLLQILPLYAITTLIIVIGLFPGVFLNILIKPVQQFTSLHQLPFVSFLGNGIEPLLSVSRASWFLIGLVAVILVVRKFAFKNRSVTVSPTWGCGYTSATPKIQYTASSFVKSYSQLFKGFFLIVKKEHKVEGIFPAEAAYETHPYDKLEKWLIDLPVTRFKRFLDRFRFFQNGKLQFYILYGIIFIILIIAIPLIYNNIVLFIDFLKQL